LQAGIPGLYFFGTRRRGRMDENRQMPQLRVGFQLTAQLRTAHQRHHPVGDHEIGDADFQVIEGFQTVARTTYRVSFVDQNSLPCGEHVRVVIHKQD
jgi:hypothetical protein